MRTTRFWNYCHHVYIGRKIGERNNKKKVLEAGISKGLSIIV